MGRWWWCWGGGAHSNKSCLVLIKGPQRSPAVTNRARTEAEDQRRGEFMLSLVGFYLQKKPLQVCCALRIFFSLALHPPPTHTLTHTNTRTRACTLWRRRQRVNTKDWNISLRLGFKVKTSKRHLENKSVLLILGAQALAGWNYLECTRTKVSNNR